MSTLTTRPRKDPKIKWNDASYKAWVHVGKDASEFVGFDFNRNIVIRFMNRIDLNFAPLKERIGTIIRIISPEYNDEGEQIGNKKKEYVYYTIEYSGRDSWKQKVNSGDIVEYRHQVIPQESEIKWRLENNQPVEQITNIDGDPVIRYHTEFSKDAVDEIIKKHDNEDRRDEIVYTVFTNSAKSSTSRERCQYSYDQFVNSEFEHLRYLANRIGGPTGDFNLGKVDESKVQVKCNCANCIKEVNK